MHFSRNVSNKIIGIPYKWKHYIKRETVWKKVADVDEDNLALMKPKSNDSSVFAIIDFDYTERVYDLTYYGFVDVFAAFGGLLAVFKIWLGWITPLFVLHFLYELASIIDDKLL